MAFDELKEIDFFTAMSYDLILTFFFPKVPFKQRPEFKILPYNY